MALIGSRPRRLGSGFEFREEEMTHYEHLKAGEEYCEEQARRFAQDASLRIFWTGSADSYRERASRLTLEEAAAPYLEWRRA